MVRRPEPRPGGRRDHRHGRQDDDLVPRRRRARGGRHPDRDDRHGRDPDRRRPGGERGPRHDPRGARRSSARSGRWSRAGDAAAVIETTSHGLALDRVDAIAYDVAILTNLTHEHLELHGTWEAYRDAKLLAVRAARRAAAGGASRCGWPATGIVNADDPSAGAFIGVAQEAGARVLTYGTDPAADVRATRVEEDQRRPADRLRRAVRARPRVDLQLVGPVQRPQRAGRRRPRRGGRPRPGGRPRRPRLASRSCPAGWSGSSSASRSGSSSTSPTARRRSQTVLDLLAPLAASRGGGLIAVFGSAGERDTAKRPLMGRIAGERARLVVVTDEDPRGEDRDGDPRRDRARRGGGRPAPRPRPARHRRPPRRHRGGLRARPARRHRAARRQGPRAVDHRPGRPDPVGRACRGRGRAAPGRLRLSVSLAPMATTTPRHQDARPRRTTPAAARSAPRARRRRARPAPAGPRPRRAPRRPLRGHPRGAPRRRPRDRSARRSTSRSPPTRASSGRPASRTSPTRSPRPRSWPSSASTRSRSRPRCSTTSPRTPSTA